MEGASLVMVSSTPIFNSENLLFNWEKSFSTVQEFQDFLQVFQRSFIGWVFYTRIRKKGPLEDTSLIGKGLKACFPMIGPHATFPNPAKQ